MINPFQFQGICAGLGAETYMSRGSKKHGTPGVPAACWPHILPEEETLYAYYRLEKGYIELRVSGGTKDDEESEPTREIKSKRKIQLRDDMLPHQLRNEIETAMVVYQADILDHPTQE